MSQPEVYPNSVIRQPDSSHSNGSFGPVFIVLAVIFVISVVACVLGRLCSRRHHSAKAVNHHSHLDDLPKTVSHRGHHDDQPKVDKHVSHGPSLGPKQWESRQKPAFKIRERGDVEFGFDKRIPSVRMANSGGGTADPPHRNFGNRPEVRFADNV